MFTPTDTFKHVRELEKDHQRIRSSLRYNKFVLTLTIIIVAIEVCTVGYAIGSLLISNSMNGMAGLIAITELLVEYFSGFVYQNSLMRIRYYNDTIKSMVSELDIAKTSVERARHRTRVMLEV